MLSNIPFTALLIVNLASCVVLLGVPLFLPLDNLCPGWNGIIIYICLLAINLVSCANQIPVAQRQVIPEVPTILLQQCEPLEQVVGTRLVDIVDTVLNNYHQYDMCADTVQAWQYWYNNIIESK